MEEQKILQRYSMGHIKTIINQGNPFFACCIEKEDIAIAQKYEPNNIQIKIKLIIRAALNHCLNSKVELFKIFVKGKVISFELQTRQGQYCFEEMNYYLYLNILNNSFDQKVGIDIMQVSYEFKRTDVTFMVRISQQGKVIQQLVENNQIIIEFGNKKGQNISTFQVSSLTLESLYSSKQPLPLQTNFQNKFKFIDKEYSQPLGVIATINQIYDSMNAKEFTVPQLQSIINSLPAYRSPQFPKQDKLYLCHDFKGGYVQDLNFNNNIAKKGANFTYRSLHIQQAQIFNYFSHYNISIPPKHWKILCRKYNTKCIGTFIIEHPVYTEQVLTSKQFALFLVGVARKCRFDGYLINIETKINSISLFKKWLDYLTNMMHSYIPNSVVIWYDSILPSNGVIQYQNGLNIANMEFYKITDGFFTNYVWDDEKILTSSKFRKHPKKVYIGNDCFGRNTYGGGMYDIYKAVNKILQYKNQLQIALFAPGFTYQIQGDNRHRFHINQLRMYKGVKFQILPFEKWKVRNQNQLGFQWKKEAEWAVSSYNVCQRSAIIKFTPLTGCSVQVQFIYQVASTPPLIDSQYKIILQVLDQSCKNILYQNQAQNFANFKKTAAEVKSGIQQVTIDSQLVGENPYAVKIIEMAKSKEQWAGNYGPRFANQALLILTYEKERNWTSKLPINQLIIGEPYHSYCNIGHGDYFYNQGTKMQESYNFMADFDIPHTHIINNPLNTQFCYDSAFIGGSSMHIKSQTSRLLKLIIPQGLNLQEQYFVQVTVKQTQQINLLCKYFASNVDQRIFTADLKHVEDINDWKRFTFKLSTSFKEVKEDIRCVLDIASARFPFKLGEIKLAKRSNKPTIEQLKCIISISRDYLASEGNYYFNIIIKSTVFQRLLVVIEEFAAFAYFDCGEAHLRNIPVQKGQNFKFQIFDVDSSLEKRTIKDISLDMAQITELIFKGTIQV